MKTPTAQASATVMPKTLKDMSGETSFEDSVEDDMEPIQYKNVRGCPSTRDVGHPHVIDIQHYEQGLAFVPDEQLTVMDAIATWLYHQDPKLLAKVFDTEVADFTTRIEWTTKHSRRNGVSEITITRSENFITINTTHMNYWLKLDEKEGMWRPCAVWIFDQYYSGNSSMMAPLGRLLATQVMGARPWDMDGTDKIVVATQREDDRLSDMFNL